MQLTGREIVNENIITGFSEKAVQQQGVDLRVDNIYIISDVIGCVYNQKTHAPWRLNEVPTSIDDSGRDVWELQPGYYEVDLMERCNIPSDAALQIKTRSSLVRCGAIVHSGQFDAGFHTDKMGCYLQVIKPIIIERYSRIAQALVYRSNPVSIENLYDGQWQNDKQRK